jgi:hypothetical protein
MPAVREVEVEDGLERLRGLAERPLAGVTDAGLLGGADVEDVVGVLGEDPGVDWTKGRMTASE